MLAERLTQIMDLLETNSSDLANYTGLNRTVISKLKNGKRLPQKNSITSEKLVRGLCHYAKANDRTDCFDALFELPATYDDTSLEGLLSDWLFTEVPSTESPQQTDPLSAPSALFSVHLDAAMTLGNISNAALSRTSHTDPSLISRYRNGSRIPLHRSETIDALCSSLYDQLIKLDKKEALARMMSIRTELLNEESFLFWLYANTTIHADSGLPEQLLHSFDSYSAVAGIPLPDFTTVAAPQEGDDANLYLGQDGLQTAVIRFLSEAVYGKAKELLLYSDEDIRWIIDDADFCKKWAALMDACVKSGVRVHIIHNYDRNPNELYEAIRLWLPLYMSGMLSSSYCSRQRSPRFSHTLFICPGIACIEGSHVSGATGARLYHYYTSADVLAFKTTEYRLLQQGTHPLLLTDSPFTFDDSSFEIYIITNTLPLATMPEELVLAFDSPGLTKIWKRFHHRLKEILSNTEIHECAYLAPPDAEDGTIPVEAFSGDVRLFYTRDQYEMHLKHLRALSEEYPSLHFVPLDAAPFPNLKLYAANTHTEIVKTDLPDLSFGFNHPPLCRTFYEFAKSYAEKHAVLET